MKKKLALLFLALSFSSQAQEVVSSQNDKGVGEFKYILTKDGVDSEEKILSTENVTIDDFYNITQKLSIDSQKDGYEITEATFKHTPYGHKTPKLGKYKLELTVQKDDQEKQKRSFVFDNVSHHEGDDKFKIQVDQLNEEGYIIVDYNKEFSTYEYLLQKEND